MAVKTTAGRVAGFGNASLVVVGLGVTDLAKSAIGYRIDEPVNRIVISNGVSCSVGPGAFQLSPDHRKVAGAMRIMTLLAKHVLRSAPGGEVGFHVGKLGLHLAGHVMT